MELFFIAQAMNRADSSESQRWTMSICDTRTDSQPSVR